MFSEILGSEALSGAKYVDLVYLVKIFHTNIRYLLAEIGFDTAENEPLRVCQKLE